MAGLLDDYMAQVQDYKKAGSIGAGLLADRPNLELGQQGLLSQMQSAESEYLNRISDPLTYYQQNPEAQGLLNVSPELDLLDLATGGGKATFIGQMAKTFNKPALALAKNMSSKGATRDEIWTATGKLNAPTYKDVDGHWKQEISDEGINFDASVGSDKQWGIAKLRADETPKARLKDAKELKAEGFSPQKIYKLTGYKESADGLIDAFQPIKKKYTNPELSKAYNFENTGINYEIETNKASAAYDPSTDSVYVYTKSMGDDGYLLNPSDKTKRYVSHELQHAIQEREGFAKGGGVDRFINQKAIYDNNINYFEDVRTNAILDARKTSEWKGYQASLDKALKSNNKADIKKWHGARTDLEKAATKDVDNELIRLYEKTKVSPFDQYRSLAGEAEARNVETRLPMSMDERVAKAPWETLDVPERGLLVRGSTRPTKSLLGI